jgi:hypothetical protein
MANQSQVNNNHRVYGNLGMNRNVSPFLPASGEWRLIMNADIIRLGVIEKRDGYTLVNDNLDTTEVLSLLALDTNSTKMLIMIKASGKLYSSDLSGNTWGAAKVSGLDTAARWTGVIMHDANGVRYLVLGNGVNVLVTTDGVTFNTLAGAPLGKYWAQLFERVFCAGVPADPDVLHASETGDLTAWSMVAPHDSYSLNIDKQNGGVIQNIKSSNDRILIYKERVMKRWDDTYLKTVMASNGATAPYSIADIDGMTFSFDREGIRQYDGNAPQLLSERIRDLIYGADLSTANIPRICGVAFKNRYLLSMGNITDEDGNMISNAWIVYDYIKNIFVLYSLADQATAMTKMITGSDGIQNVYFGDVNGNVYKMFSGNTDNGKDIQMKLQSHIIYPAGCEILITPIKMTVAAKYADEMHTMLAADYGIPDEIGETSDPVSVNTGLRDKFGNGVRGIEVFIEHSTPGKPQFFGYTLNYDIGTERIN